VQQQQHRQQQQLRRSDRPRHLPEVLQLLLVAQRVVLLAELQQRGTAASARIKT
jgi:hypothetical protein